MKERFHTWLKVATSNMKLEKIVTRYVWDLPDKKL